MIILYSRMYDCVYIVQTISSWHRKISYFTRLIKFGFLRKKRANLHCMGGAMRDAYPKIKDCINSFL